MPVNALLDWPMGTTAGFTVFQDPKVNAQVSLKGVDGSARADGWIR